MDIIFCKITHFMVINLQLNALFFLNLTANTKKNRKSCCLSDSYGGKRKKTIPLPYRAGAAHRWPCGAVPDG